MWTYQQSTGQWIDKLHIVVSTGYAGNGLGKNNPDMEGEPNVGPIPCGQYAIGKGVDRPTTGILSLPLTPKDSGAIYGRNSFFCHGDLIGSPGNASDGCPIADHTTRQLIDSSTDKILNVIR